MFDNLLQPIELGPTGIRNRLFSPPHGTTLVHGGVVTDDLIAYHRTRARGGVGLIIIEGMMLHPSYGFEDWFLYAGSDRSNRPSRRQNSAHCDHIASGGLRPWK